METIEEREPPGSSRPDRPCWLRVARAVYLTLLAAVVVWVVVSRWSELADLLETARIGWLLAALALAVGQLLPSTVVWTLGLRGFGEHQVGLGDAWRATRRSVPARYLPGSVWYAMGRAALLKEARGVPAGTLAVVATLETALSLLVAAALAGALLAAAGEAVVRPWLLLGGAGVATVLGTPPLLNRGLAWWARRHDREPPPALGWGRWGLLVGATVVHWGWSVATFSVYLAAFPELSAPDLLETAGSFLAAWVVGFLSLFAPQGAGVFEATAAALLKPGAVLTAAIVVGGYRAVIAVRDLLVFAWPGRSGEAGRVGR